MKKTEISANEFFRDYPDVYQRYVRFLKKNYKNICAEADDVPEIDFSLPADELILQMKTKNYSLVSFYNVDNKYIITFENSNNGRFQDYTFCYKIATNQTFDCQSTSNNEIGRLCDRLCDDE